MSGIQSYLRPFRDARLDFRRSFPETAAGDRAYRMPETKLTANKTLKKKKKLFRQTNVGHLGFKDGI